MTVFRTQEVVCQIQKPSDDVLAFANTQVCHINLSLVKDQNKPLTSPKAGKSICPFSVCLMAFLSPQKEDEILTDKTAFHNHYGFKLQRLLDNSKSMFAKGQLFWLCSFLLAGSDHWRVDRLHCIWDRSLWIYYTKTLNRHLSPRLDFSPSVRAIITWETSFEWHTWLHQC